MNSPCIFILCSAISNANMRAFNSYAESLKRHSLYFVCICTCFILTRKWECPTKLTQLFLFHFSICTHSTCTAALGLLLSKEEQKRNGTFPLSFRVIIFSMKRRATTGKEHERKSTW